MTDDAYFAGASTPASRTSAPEITLDDVVGELPRNRDLVVVYCLRREWEQLMAGEQRVLRAVAATGGGIPDAQLEWGGSLDALTAANVILGLIRSPHGLPAVVITTGTVRIETATNRLDMRPAAHIIRAACERLGIPVEVIDPPTADD